MTTAALLAKTAEKFRQVYGRPHTVAAYAPGRVEVLGNHTDYNEGYVLSAAIDCGTCFLAAPANGTVCRLTAGDLMDTVSFPADHPARLRGWVNYGLGVFAGLRQIGAPAQAFDGLFFSDVPHGAGLSSSAALEISTGLGLAALYGMNVPPVDLARIGQKAEHEFAGVKCGLLDQLSSLFGQQDRLVMTDFRSLDVQTVDLGHDAAFLMCRTHARHALVDGEYNERRRHCEEAARFFGSVLPHPVHALRDVSWAEWEAHQSAMPPLTARRAAHPIGENERVLNGRERLAHGDLAGFGQLMYASHDSSRRYFENSCPELDTLVDAAQARKDVFGARLSGGGFGGSVVALVHPKDARQVGNELRAAYARTYGSPCDIRVIQPSAGARVLKP